MSEIIEQIGDPSYPVGLIIRMGIMGATSVKLGVNVMAAIGEATHGPAMTVLPLTSESETSLYYKSGPLARAGKVAFAQDLPAGDFIRVMGQGHAAAQKNVHDGLVATETETFYGDGDEGPYPLGYNCYTQNVANSVQIALGSPLDIVYTPDALLTGKVYLDQENGTLLFFEGEGPEDDELVTCSLGHYGNLGVLASPNSGISGNSGFVDIADGTFPGHYVGVIPGDGSAGPYYLPFHNIIQDDDNLITVGDVVKTIVYSPGDLASGKVYVNCSTGGLTFFAGQEPAADVDAIGVAVAYESKKLTIHDGDISEPAIDNMVDLVAIQAALMYNSIMGFTPDALATHLPANGRYQLAGGLDGVAITTDDYADAMDILMQYLEDTCTNVTTVVFCANTIEPGGYDLIPILAGKINEMKRNFYPAIGFIGLDPNIDPAAAIKIGRNYANYELVIVVNPWDATQPDRLDGTVARAAQTAVAPLGTSCARRVSNMSLQGLSPFGLLNTYRKETVKALHNGRLDVLIKSDAGIFTFYGRNTANEEQYMECVDVCTMNYMIWVIKYYTDHIYFAKNTPSVRATFREDIANTLDRLEADEAVDDYHLDVTSGRSEGNKSLMRVKLEADNVGHIKQVIVDYYNGILEGSKVA
jgi:hypothetical protein